MKEFRVVEKITGTKIILNCGRKNDIKFGQTFLVYGLTKFLIDPDTQEELGQAEIIRGKGVVIHLQDKMCTIESCVYEKGESKIIKRTSPNSIFAIGMESTTEEEIIGKQTVKVFDDVQVGDYARLI